MPERHKFSFLLCYFALCYFTCHVLLLAGLSFCKLTLYIFLKALNLIIEYVIIIHLFAGLSGEDGGIQSNEDGEYLSDILSHQIILQTKAVQPQKYFDLSTDE